MALARAAWAKAEDSVGDGKERPLPAGLPAVRRPIRRVLHRRLSSLAL
jgi:hypothetical protein